MGPRDPALDWSAWNVKSDPANPRTSEPGTGGDATGGFGKAVEMCNNNGYCRKFDAGVMCPSYRVTHDERPSTRGRASTSLLALSGQLGPASFTSNELHAHTGLTVGRQVCSRDCPNRTETARMTTEFCYHWHKQPVHAL